MVTLQKHYTNNPTTKNTFIIAHVAILMAREGIYTERQNKYIIITFHHIYKLL